MGLFLQVGYGPVWEGKGTCLLHAHPLRSRGRVRGKSANTCVCLCARLQGVFVPNFCRLGWEIVATMGGGNRQAPYFELTDHFCRSHGLPVKRKPNPLQRANEGEINFIKLAIKCVSRPVRAVGREN